MTTPPSEIFWVPADCHRVVCGGGALGHPKVYYTFDGADSVTCGYCGRLFTRQSLPGARTYSDAV